MRRSFILILLMTAFASSIWSAEAILSIHGFQAMPGDTAQLTLTVSPNKEIVSLEADLLLPVGFSVVDTPKEQNAEYDNHILGIRHQTAGRAMHIMFWSPTNDLIDHMELSIAIDATLPTGSYIAFLSDVLLVSSDGTSLSSNDKKSVIEIIDTDYREDFATNFTDAPISQAWVIRNLDTDLNLQLRSTTKKITLEIPNDASDFQHFFLEPAYDHEEGMYYLRSTEGYYLCYIKDGNTYKISASDNPNTASVFILSATDDRTYSFTILDDGICLSASGNKAGQELLLSKNSKYHNWQLYPCKANHATYFEKLYDASSAFLGLTHGQADLDFRRSRHEIRISVDEGIDDDSIITCINRLDEAVSSARRAYILGDNTTIEDQWGDAETFPTDERYITTIADDGNLRYLTFVNGKLSLTSQISPIVLDGSWLKDAYFNYNTDSYAIRVSGSGIGTSGSYLVVSELANEVNDTLISTLSESLACWSILSIQQIMQQRYLLLSGKSGTSANWSFNQTTGTLTLEGHMRTHSYVTPEVRPWHIFRHLIRHVVISGDISLLGANLFNGCTNLESLTFITTTKPIPADGTYEGVPVGVNIYAANPEDYQNYLPDCKTHFLASVKKTYMYEGVNQQPLTEGFYDATVIAGNLEKDAGTYTTIFTIATIIEGKTYEYTGPFTYSILPSPLTLAAHDYSRMYGANNPKFSVSINGLKGMDTEKSMFTNKPEAYTYADNISPAGAYPIFAIGGELANENYVLRYQHATLTIRPKPLSIIADNMTCYQGEPIPKFTYSCIGFANGDDEKILTEIPVLSCIADSTSAPGKYPITITGGKAFNYSIVTANGILTILEGTDVGCIHEKSNEIIIPIFDLYGRPILVDEEQEANLPTGIYIINGKKTIIQSTIK